MLQVRDNEHRHPDWYLTGLLGHVYRHRDGQSLDSISPFYRHGLHIAFGAVLGGLMT